MSCTQRTSKITGARSTSRLTNILPSSYIRASESLSAGRLSVTKGISSLVRSFSSLTASSLLPGVMTIRSMFSGVCGLAVSTAAFAATSSIAPMPTAFSMINSNVAFKPAGLSTCAACAGKLPSFSATPSLYLGRYMVNLAPITPSSLFPGTIYPPISSIMFSHIAMPKPWNRLSPDVFVVTPLSKSRRLSRSSSGIPGPSSLYSTT